MNSTRDVTTCCARLDAPRASPPRPLAAAGARVVRASRDTLAPRRMAIVTFEIVAAPLRAERTVLTATVDDAGVSLAEGTAPFEALRSNVVASARRTSVDGAWVLAAIEQARPAVEARARARFELALRSALSRGARSVALTLRYAQELIDESPAERRDAVAARALDAVHAARAHAAPSLTIAPLVALELHATERRARWRVAAHGASDVVESGVQFDGRAFVAPCDGCGEPALRWTVCPTCAAARCERCARRCRVCERVACARCAPSDRCPACGRTGL
jgi:hypothetical protein